MCGCFQSVSNTVGTHISGRNERPGLSQQLHEGYCVPLVKGLACKRQCSCLLPSWLSLFPCGSPVSEQSLVSCQLEVWVVVSLEPQSYQNWSVPPLSLMVFWDLIFFSVFKNINHIDSFLFFKQFFYSLWPGMEISPLGISNHKLGNFSKAGRKQYWWPTELSQSLRVGEHPDPVWVQLLLLTTVPGNGDCCGCTGGRWDSGIWVCDERGEVQVLPKGRCHRITSECLMWLACTWVFHQFVLGCSVPETSQCLYGVPWPPLEDSLRTLSLFIMFSEQTHLPVFPFACETPTEALSFWGAGSKRETMQNQVKCTGSEI